MTPLQSCPSQQLPDTSLLHPVPMDKASPSLLVPPLQKCHQSQQHTRGLLMLDMLKCHPTCMVLKDSQRRNTTLRCPLSLLWRLKHATPPKRKHLSNTSLRCLQIKLPQSSWMAGSLCPQPVTIKLPTSCQEVTGTERRPLPPLEELRKAMA